jgi:hypothetical protein
MTGNEHKRVVIQERDRTLFWELYSVLRVATRTQIEAVARFGSTTRANARLLALTNAGLLRRFFIGTTAAGRKALYSLAPKGARSIGVPFRGVRRLKDEALIPNFFIGHQLAVNEVYCALKFRPIPIPNVNFITWRSFEDSIAPNLILIPDGYVELDTPLGPLSVFLEVDLGKESLRVWKEKVRNYLDLAMSRKFQEIFGKSHFRVAVLANSPRRMHSIRSTVAPITKKIFWFSSLEEVEREGFLGPIWFRPHGDQPTGFVQPS